MITLTHQKSPSAQSPAPSAQSLVSSAQHPAPCTSSKRLRILVSAYACSPGRGSEPGMGWNFVLGLSRFHEVHVIAEKLKWEKPVTEFLEQHPDLAGNLKFYFIEKKRNKLLRKIWPPSYYWYYRAWQKEAYRLAVELDAREHFDLVHQLNMVGYREPGYLWKMAKPFVWGPIGGLENSPWRFLPSLGLVGIVFYVGRNLLNVWQRRFMVRPRKAAQRPNASLIAATRANARYIRQLWDRNSEVICEVGQEPGQCLAPAKREAHEPLKILFSGLHISRKNLPLLLKSLQRASFPFQLHVLGDGPLRAAWKRAAVKYGVDHAVIWHGWVGRDQAMDLMGRGHVFCITSISDLTSTVTLEALSYGLPIICLDHCGFSDVVNESCGIKIPVHSPKQAVADFAAALETLQRDELFRQRLSAGAVERAKEYRWDKKIERLNGIYLSLLEKEGSC